jgi:O-succinylbenzoic acid--CoA ligase
VQGEGRIRVRGPNVMTGYANAAHESGHGLGDGWFVSGDRGYFDACGNLVVLGRHDDVLVSGGVNVHPAEVEGLLLACPGVSDVAVTGVSDAVWGDRIAALVVGRVDDLQEWCRDRLPSHLRPRLFVAVGALPRNALGKLERKRLPALARAMEKPC